MKVSVANGWNLIHLGVEKGTKLMADAGFEAVDFSLTQNTTPWEEGCLTDVSHGDFAAHFKRVAKIVRDHGVELYQSHASYCKLNCLDPEKYSLVQRQTIRGIYASGHMECPHIVAHPVVHPDFHNGQNSERCLRTNLDYFSAFVPALKDTGVTMCIENLFWGDTGVEPNIPNACSSAEQLIGLIDTLNDLHGPHFAACLDTGHAVIGGNDPAEMLRALGKRVRVLHIQDNGGCFDDHLVPGRGVIDWRKFLAAMKDVGYGGTFNFEVDYYGDYNKDIYGGEVLHAATKRLYEIGRSMADIAETGR